MGRGNRGGSGRGRGRGRGRGGGNGNRERADNRVSYDKIDKTNEKLEKYYNSVLGLSDEEKEEFWAALKRELPNSFRFAGSKGNALAVQKKLRERYIPEITRIAHNDGTMVEPPQPVPWYPNDLAWWMTTPKSVVRRFPPFAAFQKFLVSETGVGNISRQEVVSMIPPLVIDIKPGMTVLDMCAAPGSKAAQLLEMVHDGEEARVRAALRQHAKEDGREISPGLDVDGDVELDVDSKDYGRTTGLLIANDSDYKRAHMLIHQLKRLASPNLIVTNHDATMYPSIKLPSTPENPSVNRYLKFDRILADVPCSGDGTCRKNPALWKEWSPQSALGLYTTQVRILVRALQMLKVGGRVVYSTCSMNPVENEAVVAAAIDRCGGLNKVELVDCSDRLPLLKRKPGLREWTIMDKSGQTWNSWEDVEAANNKYGEDPTRTRLVESMFVPKDNKIPFERCMRVYAHQQDTGGFFITVLQKKAEIRARPESESKKIEAKPPVTSIVDEIMAQPVPKAGENVAPKIEAADRLVTKTEESDLGVNTAPVARQNQAEPVPDATLKRERTEDDEKTIDAAMATKKLKTRADGEDEPAEAGLEERRVHYPPPPGAELGLNVRPGDLRSNNNNNNNGNSRKSGNGSQQFEEPFKYIPSDQSEVQIIEKFYNLSPRFPRDRFLVRNAAGDPAKTIYYTSALIRDILTENEGKGIKFIHGGVKMFMKQDVQGQDVCRWRIQSEGMPILEGYVGEERVVRLYKKATLKKLLVEMFPKVAGDSWQELGEIGERVRDIPMGCCVLRIEPSDDEDGFEGRVVLPLWRSVHSLNLMLAKEDRTAMLLRIYDDSTTELINHQKDKDAQARKDAEGDEKTLAPGFHMENGEIHVDVTNSAIEGNGPVAEDAPDLKMKPGPYGVLVDEDTNAFNGRDVKAQTIAEGKETGGQEQQLGGMGGVEGQQGTID